MIRDTEKRGRPRTKKEWTAELIYERAERYFKKCDGRMKETLTKDGVVPVANPEPYTIEGLCCFLDISRQKFDEWRSMPDDIGEAARSVMQQIVANIVAGGLDGSQSASLAQFVLKNALPEFYQDKNETEVSVSDDTAELFGVIKWREKNLKE